MTKLIVDGLPEYTRGAGAQRLDPTSNLDELFDQFEKLPLAEQKRQIAEANDFLRANGIEGLDRLGKGEDQ